MDERFPALEKLKSKILIDSLFVKGKSLYKYPLKLVYLPIENSINSVNKTGVSVPKRNFKKAVDRIYLKRLIREAYRKNKYLVEGKTSTNYAFMFIYTAREKIDFEKLQQSVQIIIKNFNEKEAYENNSN